MHSNSWRQRRALGVLAFATLLFFAPDGKLVAGQEELRKVDRVEGENHERRQP